MKISLFVKRGLRKLSSLVEGSLYSSFVKSWPKSLNEGFVTLVSIKINFFALKSLKSFISQGLSFIFSWKELDLWAFLSCNWDADLTYFVKNREIFLFEIFTNTGIVSFFFRFLGFFLCFMYLWRFNDVSFFKIS